LAKTALYKWKTWGLTAPAMGSFASWGGGICITSPENVKHVLKDSFSKYEKTHMLNSTLNEFLGNGIFTSDGDVWKFHRKVAVRMFSKNLLDYGTDVALNEAKKLMKKLDTAAKTGEIIDLQKCFYSFTMDVFAQIAFGVEFNSQEKDHRFTKAFDTCQRICQSRFSKPFWKIDRFFQLSQDERAVSKAKKVIVNFAETVIEGKRRDSKGKNGHRSLGKDLISRMLDESIQRDKKITNKDLIDVVLNFIIAGRDTTAAALSWTMFELIGKQDNIIDKAVASVEKETGGKQLQELREEEIFKIIYTKLGYIKAMLSEGLRLHPSVAKDLKYAVEDDVLPDGTKVKKGMVMFYSPYVMGRSPQLWKDPLRYDPQRWIEPNDGGDKKADKKSKQSLFRPSAISDFKYVVFNAGPRVCLGRPLAYLEMQLMMGLLLPRYRFTLVEPHDGKYVQTIVAPLKDGFKVKVAMRKE
jgi:cytochrome P450